MDEELLQLRAKLDLFKTKVKELEASLGIDERMPDNDDVAGIISDLNDIVKKCEDGLRELDTLFTMIRLTKESLDRKVSAMLSGHEAMDEEP
ncbi:hypothetical protein BT96DRAFT_1008077 [Gymnopus androsaceus JB14]|uniref:Uncharacterized protein n=1 Tax=Gymnopus androsaceus JB14 TaxID=1447944 RepID=A0A6A4GG84_9AGAR|nr:hypothetical protein BT96DRAFT_1008077 [Gymnopus androsaceus JB14]